VETQRKRLRVMTLKLQVPLFEANHWEESGWRRSRKEDENTQSLG
jgi:hypothetical protein